MQSTSQPLRILITGANRGIGLATTLGLLKSSKPNTIIMAFRRHPDSLALFKKLKEEHIKTSPSSLHYIQLDINNSQQRQDAKRQIKQKYGGLDILVNNAALGYDDGKSVPSPQLAKDYLTCNVLSTVALTETLLSILEPTKGRIVNVSSKLGAIVLHSPEKQQIFRSCIHSVEDIEAIIKQYVQQCELGKLQGWSKSAYGTTKTLLNAYTRFILGPRMQNHQTVLSVTPGYCMTDMVKDKYKEQKGYPVPKPASEGARSLLHCILEAPYSKSQNTKFYSYSESGKVQEWNYETLN